MTHDAHKELEDFRVNVIQPEPFLAGWFQLSTFQHRIFLQSWIDSHIFNEALVCENIQQLALPTSLTENRVWDCQLQTIFMQAVFPLEIVCFTLLVIPGAFLVLLFTFKDTRWCGRSSLGSLSLAQISSTDDSCSGFSHD